MFVEERKFPLFSLSSFGWPNNITGMGQINRNIKPNLIVHVHMEVP